MQYIKDLRYLAWHFLGLETQGLFNEARAGQAILAYDELCCKMYRALRSVNSEDLAVARHTFEEFYDIGPFDPPPVAGERPPEITAELRAKYGPIIGYDGGLLPGSPESSQNSQESSGS